VRTKNLTPFPFGARVTSSKPPEPELVLVVRGRFRLVQGGVVVPVSRALDDAESDFPELAPTLLVLGQGPLRAEEYALDDTERRGAPTYPGDFADAKLHGEALLVGSAYAPERKPVGRCDVSFRVGNWEKRLAVFGARGWEEGLLGQKPTDPVPFLQLKLGYERASGGDDSPHNPIGIGMDGHLLPFVEYPNERVRSPGDRPKPAGFGPLSAEWPFRKRKLGVNYGPTYAARAPFYADDFDWRYFQAAPRDQWVEGYFRGDEAVVLENLHRDHARLETRLPGLRIRAFVHDVAKNFREVPMLLDTVFVTPDENELLLTWRGRTPVLDLELDDVTTVLLATEPLDGPARPLDAWREDLLRFEADPLGLDELPPELGALMKANGPTEQTRAALAFVEQAHPGAVANANELLAKAPEGGDLESRITRALAEASDEPPPVPILGGTQLHLGLRESMAKARAAIAENAPAELAAFDAALEPEKLRSVDPTFRAPNELPAGPALFAPSANLDGRDLSGLDLSGANLEGASLRGAILRGTILRGANLARADFEGALVFRTDLTAASLVGAGLVRVNAAEAILDAADCTGARLEMAFFGTASCRGACFDATSGKHTHFSKANLGQATFHGARLEQPDFEGATLDATDFAGAELSRALFFEAKTTQLCFDGARLEGVSFEAAVLSGATFLGAQGSGLNFSGADLSGTDFRWSRFDRSQFVKVRANEARFDNADLTGARFFKADLTRASFQDAKLVSSDFCRARLDATRFDRAHLYDAKFLGAKGAEASFANVEASFSVRF
jgi:uncharacterized protein YjbI with pentapeptide repeats